MDLRLIVYNNSAVFERAFEESVGEERIDFDSLFGKVREYVPEIFEKRADGSVREHNLTAIWGGVLEYLDNCKIYRNS